MSSKRTILLIDDDVFTQQMVKSSLQSKGYTVETANDGFQGLEKLKTVTPHLIVLDVTMPNMGGLTFYQKICDATNHPKFPVLILTARASMEQLFQDLFIDGFMKKPFQRDELLEKIEAIINKRFGAIKTIVVSGIERVAQVCIVEDDPEESKKISEAFSNAGYVVNAVASGTQAMENIYGSLPDIAVVKLALPDIGGDSIIIQLKGMARSKHIKFILYMKQTHERTVIIDKISQKPGIDCFVEYLYGHEFLAPANELLKQYAQMDTV